jgi:glycosyltransferase involved in cell wall biosynthesis
MSKLTIVIPFLGEGDEVEKTVASIKATATGSPAIILINDGSTDGYDYRSVADRYGCRYVEHATRQGVAASRDEGVQLAETPCVLLLDAHMELYGSGWDKRIVALLKERPRAVLCSRSEPLTDDRKLKHAAGGKKSGGALLDLSQPRYAFKAKWSYTDSAPDIPLAPIGCILGAAYAVRRDYYLKLHGLHGLRSYGFDEELLSLKVRMSGGECLLVKDWTTGHIYGRKARRAFVIYTRDSLYNQLMIMELLMGDGEAEVAGLGLPSKAACVEKLRSAHGRLLDEVATEIQKEAEFIGAERAYLRSVFAEVDS